VNPDETDRIGGGTTSAEVKATNHYLDVFSQFESIQPGQILFAERKNLETALSTPKIRFELRG
jgi:hypothetical protein